MLTLIWLKLKSLLFNKFKLIFPVLNILFLFLIVYIGSTGKNDTLCITIIITHSFFTIGYIAWVVKIINNYKSYNKRILLALEMKKAHQEKT
jgi:hypothetical protein